MFEFSFFSIAKMVSLLSIPTWFGPSWLRAKKHDFMSDNSKQVDVEVVAVVAVVITVVITAVAVSALTILLQMLAK